MLVKGIQAGTLLFYGYARQVERPSDPRRTVERIQNSLTGPLSYESLDTYAAELTDVGSQATADVETAFAELVTETDAA